MIITLHEEALNEFDAAVAYYEEKEPGLGLEFADEVEATIRKIVEHPIAWSRFSRNTRRSIVNRING